MEKFFVVGLGGSGGKTLQFLMNTLSQELLRFGWTDPLPACWQFVHIDLPPKGDGVGPDFPPTVAEQGGSYVQVVSQHDSYASLDLTLEQQLVNQAEAGGLRALAPWRPARSQVGVPLQFGAGQYRAVGRLATLAHAGDIYQGLRDAAVRVRGHAATAAQQQLADLLRVTVSPDAQPMVLVVSSLAGGTGASMTLDVCNLLRAVPEIPGHDSVALLYTPEVFSDLAPHERAGVDANALATMSELLAALGNYNTPWNDQEWAIYSASGGKPNSRNGRGPARVIPIGAKSDGVPFGDGRSRTIYEGTARALASMMLSSVQTNDFRAYTHTNFSQSLNSVGDNFGLDTDPAGGQAQVYGFLSIGFGSVGLGRDRYAEYAAQRIARAALERLVSGHRDERIARGEITEVQALEQRARYCYDPFVEWAGLPPLRSLETGQRVLQRIADGLWPQAEQLSLASRIVDEMSAPIRASEGTGDYLANSIRNASQNSQPQMLAATDERVAAAAERWVPATQSAIETATLRVIAEFGVAVSIKVLEQFRADLLASSALVATARTAGAAQAALNADFQILSAVSQRVKGAYGQVEKVVGRLRGYYLSMSQDTVYRALSGLMEQLANDVVRPLENSLRDVNESLHRALADSADDRVMATVRTDSVALWPGAGPVPRRFATATNEVLLEDVGQYRTMFDQHIGAELVGNAASAEEAMGAAVEDVIMMITSPDRSTAQVRPVDGLAGLTRLDGMDVPVRMGRVRGWWPSILAARTPSVAAYAPSLRPVDLLATARTWVGRPNTSFGQFITEGLRSHLTDRGAGEQVLRDRQDTFIQKLDQALRLARPLANYDAGQLNALHNASALSLSIQLSEIPLAGTVLEERVRHVLLSFPGVDVSNIEANLQARMTTNEQRSRIDIIDALPPLSPLALTSLQLPIRERWQAAQTSETARLGFWQWRRGRSLVDFVPVLRSWLDAMVLGWMIGRLVGDVTIPRESHLPSARVWDESIRSWQSFPNPLLGLQRQNDLDAWSLLAAVLESMPLAMAKSSGDPRFTDLLPYRTLRDIGRRAGNSGNAVLAGWLSRGTGASGDKNTFLPIADVASTADRTAAAKAWVDDVNLQFRRLLPPTDTARYLPGSDLAVLTMHNFDAIRAPSSWELAGVIVKATESLRQDLDDPTYQRGSGFEAPIG